MTCLGDGQRRAPLILKDVEANATVGVDVAVVDAGRKIHLAQIETRATQRSRSGCGCRLKKVSNSQTGRDEAVKRHIKIKTQPQSHSQKRHNPFIPSAMGYRYIFFIPPIAPHEYLGRLERIVCRKMDVQEKNCSAVGRVVCVRKRRCQGGSLPTRGAEPKLSHAKEHDFPAEPSTCLAP